MWGGVTWRILALQRETDRAKEPEMHLPTFQEWQHLRDTAQPREPLAVVVVEYRPDGCAIERERMMLSSNGAERPAAPPSSTPARRSVR